MAKIKSLQFKISKAVFKAGKGKKCAYRSIISYFYGFQLPFLNKKAYLVIKYR
ncbi:MAG: hypothetical protein IKT32_03410 [Clostridia bacterium]|nr:hypothetical protein [Clostridia bacterium]